MSLDDIVGNTETIERLKVIARDGNMPHLIISVIGFIGDWVDEGNAWNREDDEYHGPCPCLAWRCFQGRRTRTERFR